MRALADLIESTGLTRRALADAIGDVQCDDQL